MPEQKPAAADAPDDQLTVALAVVLRETIRAASGGDDA